MAGLAPASRDLAGSTVMRYQEIIDSVVGRVRGEFNQEGVDEQVLDEVRALWEAKLVATGVIGEPSNEGQQVIQQQQLQHAPRPGLPPGAMLPGALPMPAGSGASAATVAAVAAQQQQQYLALRQQYAAAGIPGGLPVGMQPGGMMLAAGGPPHMNMAALAVMQAQARAQAQAQAQVQAAAAEQKRKLEAVGGAGGAPDAKQQRTIPQQDGPADDAGGEGGAEDEAGAGATGEEEEDDDPLTEDEEGSGDEVDEASVPNVVLGQFEKVQRSKSKWKVVLKDCILTLNGRDYLVRRCNGEMDFL